MNSIVPIKLALASLLFISTCPPPVSTNSLTFGVFVATSPCNDVSQKLLAIPPATPCEMIKWNLTLYQDATTLAPTTYQLNLVYGLPKPNTNGLLNGGTSVQKNGKWTITRRTKADPDAVVYVLETGTQQGRISFKKLDDNLLHLLDLDERLAIGNGGWSYTLNRSEGLRPNAQQASVTPTSSIQSNSRATASPGTTASSTLGRFVGRSPCLEVAKQLNQPGGPDCMKVKWDLTLYQDPLTATPTRYKLRGTFYRDLDKEGKWAILRGANSNPAAVIYQLDPDKPGGSLLFLKPDDNVLFFLDSSRNLLVGNADFSYTLNRDK